MSPLIITKMFGESTFIGPLPEQKFVVTCITSFCHVHYTYEILPVFEAHRSWITVKFGKLWKWKMFFILVFVWRESVSPLSQHRAKKFNVRIMINSHWTVSKFIQIIEKAFKNILWNFYIYVSSSSFVNPPNVPLYENLRGKFSPQTSSAFIRIYQWLARLVSLQPNNRLQRVYISDIA